MFLARVISRGACLKARLGVNGIQKESRSLGTAGATGRLVASGMDFSSGTAVFGRSAVSIAENIHTPEAARRACAQAGSRRTAVSGGQSDGSATIRGSRGGAQAPYR